MIDDQSMPRGLAGPGGLWEENAFHRSLKDRWSRLGPWRRRGILFLLGALSGSAFAPIHFIPGWLAGWCGMIWALRAATGRRAAFFEAWAWSLGQVVPGIYWITSSFLIDAARFGWLALPCVGALAAYLALYPAAALLVAWRQRHHPLAFVLILAGAWTIAEWLRGYALTGFPWNLAAYVWAFSTPMMQSASIWGAWGLSLVTVLATGLFVIGAGASRTRAARPLIACVGILLALYGHGAWRLATLDPPATAIALRLVQANISQWDKLTGRDREGQIYRHLELTNRPGKDATSVVIWPETAATLFLDREIEWRRLIASAAPVGGYLVTGGLRGEPIYGQPEKYWNSLYALDRDGQVLATFDKFHLVPLGEFVPLRQYLPFVGKLTGGAGNFSSGDGPRTLRLPGLPSVSPLICYEVIFPGEVADRADRPQWLLNLTNDGWFGRSSGPYQHFASARFRAIEEGLPLIRAANSGISGAIDSLGRVLARTRLGEVAILDIALPGALPPTVFTTWGQWLIAAMIIICVIGSLIFATSNRRAAH